MGPGTNTAIVQNAITPGVYTIVSEATGQGATLWGKLKSGKGCVVRNPIPIVFEGQEFEHTSVEAGETITVAGREL